MHKLRALTTILLLATLAACTVHQQKVAIRDARYGLATAGEVIGVVDLAVDNTWGSAPMEDTDAYCNEMKASLVLEQALQVVYAGADAVFMWELALKHYEVAEGKVARDAAWASVLNSQSEWFLMASTIVGVLDALRATLELYGLVLPGKALQVWAAISWLAAHPAGATHEWDWSSLEGSVCAGQ